MEPNETVTYFIMKGLSDAPELQAPIFVLVLLIYLFVLVGNTSLLLLVCLDSHLHTPMYFFLANLSVVDMTSSTVTLHKILLTFITGDNTVLYLACIIQFYMFSVLQAHEIFILTAMGYDRYVAICKPLNYKIIMDYKICLLLASFCWLFGFIQYVPFIWFVSKISCYFTNVIDHFCCDLVPLMAIACSDLTMSIMKIRSSIGRRKAFYTCSSHLTVIVLLYTTLIIQYLIPKWSLSIDIIESILSSHFWWEQHFSGCCGNTLWVAIGRTDSCVGADRSIMKIRSSIGRRKAFYTCSSHLTVIVLLYSTLIFQYLIPVNVPGLKKWFSLFNMAIVPLLNPLIYSLKNKDVKTAFRRRIWKCKANKFCCIAANVIGVNKQI
ncbi:olfactory receptor 5B12-like [Dendropsophus ebraccatus]|uniref:olfactory receptor 5B12-like n=1 Tax=Dendropsophus ebraccatus TaxID=150705 RepID=UPI0038315513